MQENDLTEFWRQVNIFFIKYLSIPALLALSIKIAVQVANKKATMLGVLVSLIVGLGFAYFVTPIAEYLTENKGFQAMIVGFVAILGDKIAIYLIFDIEVNGWFKEVGDIILQYIRKVLGLNDNDNDTTAI